MSKVGDEKDKERMVRYTEEGIKVDGAVEGGVVVA